MNTPQDGETQSALDILCAPEWQQIAEKYLNGNSSQQINQLKQLLGDSEVESKAEFEDFNAACSKSFGSDPIENEALFKRCHDHKHVWKYTLHLLILLRDDFEKFCIERRLECGSLDLEGQAKPFIKAAEINYWQSRLAIFSELGSVVERSLTDLPNTDIEDLKLLQQSIRQMISELERLDPEKIQRRSPVYEVALNIRNLFRVLGG